MFYEVEINDNVHGMIVEPLEIPEEKSRKILTFNYLQEANKMDAIKKDELFDDELCGMVKFTDATVKSQKPVESEKKSGSKLHGEEKKTAHVSTREPIEAEYEPVKTWYDEKAVNCVKWFLIFAGMEYLFFYWQQTGQMQESAAMPSMLVCALLAGISVGKNWKWRK